MVPYQRQQYPYRNELGVYIIACTHIIAKPLLWNVSLSSKIFNIMGRNWGLCSHVKSVGKLP